MRIAAHSRMQADRIVLETVVSKKVREAWSKDTGKISKEQVTENQKKLNRFGIRAQ